MENAARINIRITPEEKKILTDKAKAAGLSLPVYLIAVALDARPVPRTKTRYGQAQIAQGRMQVTVRCTHDERAQLEKVANTYGLTLSAFLINKGLGKKLRRPRRPLRTEIDAATLDALNSLGAQLNEHAKAVNSGLPYSVERIEQTIDGISSAVAQDDRLAGLLVDAVQGRLRVPPFAIPAWLTFSRIHNNLAQLGAVVGSKVVTDAAEVFRRLMVENADNMARDFSGSPGKGSRG